jgi:type II secretion system protein H
MNPGLLSLRSEAEIQGGFTLMELMLVLTLIAIMAAMIVPEMKGSMEDALLRSSARKVVDVFNLTYSRAVSFNQLHRVILDQSTGKFRVERKIADSPNQSDFEPIKDLNGFEGQIDPRIAIEIRATQAQPSDEQMPEDEPKSFFRDGINFYADGTADGCEILLRDRMGVEVVLQLNPITANIHMLDQDQETP